MSNGFLSMGPDYTPGTSRTATGSMLDDILYQLARPVETEGMFDRAEALYENAYSQLSKIANDVPPEQQADALAEYLRTSGFSSDVVEQTLGIPKEEVNAALEAAGYTVTGDVLPTKTKSPLELIQTGPVPTDTSSAAASAAAGGGEETIVDLSAKSTDDLTADTTASTIDGSDVDTSGGLVTAAGTNYGWVYNKDTDSFDYGYFDLEGNRVSTGDSVKRGAVFGTENKTFEEGDSVSLMPRQDGQFYIEHGGTDKYAPSAGKTVKDQQTADFLKILNDLIAGTIDLGAMRNAAENIYGKGTIAESQAVTNATTMINTGSTNVDDVVASVTNVGGKNTYTPEGTGAGADTSTGTGTGTGTTTGTGTGTGTDTGTGTGTGLRDGLGDGAGNGTGDGTGDGFGDGNGKGMLAVLSSTIVPAVMSEPSEAIRPQTFEMNNVSEYSRLIKRLLA